MKIFSRYLKGPEELKDLVNTREKPCVAILGSYNSGKSTLINNLLEEEISPVGAAPTTSCLMHFAYGECFKACYTAPGEKRSFERKEHLISFLSGKKTPEGQVDIWLPSPFLRKCRLLDTPGLDFLSGNSDLLAEQAVTGAAKIVYLFHQRGIEDFNRLFLHKLAARWKGRALGDISFWLNCNLGHCDGTSLEATRSVLREIFPGQVRVNTINTRDRSNIEVLRLFLEAELARSGLSLAHSELKKLDQELSRETRRIAGITNDFHFLAGYWQLQEKAGRILDSVRLLHSLPSVLQELESRLELLNKANLGAVSRQAGGRPCGPRALGLKEIKEGLLGVALDLLGNRQLAPFPDRGKLAALARQIEEKRFTVVLTGGFSTGKSTFLNALLKEEILPAADGPTTVSSTRLCHGTTKKATVHYPLQVSLQVYEQVGARACLLRENLTAVERWLNGPGPGPARLEVCTGGRYQDVGRGELIQLISRVRTFFGAGSSAGTAGAPAAFRSVSLKSLRGSSLLQEIRVTFDNSGSREFDLTRPEGLANFKNATAPDNVFKIDWVEIQHPCEFLKLADFVDTPGLDWIQKHQLKSTSGQLEHSDFQLFFLNARHILNDLDRENLDRLLKARAGRQQDFPGNDFADTFIVVNFADVLTPAQRESVYNFIRKSSCFNPGEKGGPGLYLISSLKALAGEDGGMNALLKKLEEGLLRRRGRDYYLGLASELNLILEQSLQQLNSETFSGKNALETKKIFKELREARRRLKELRTQIFTPGGLD